MPAMDINYHNYAINIFGSLIGSGQTLMAAWKTELVTPCCHTKEFYVEREV